MKHNKVALVLLGVIGVIAIGGLVLMYSQSMSTGFGVYSNPAKYNYAYPNWNQRGVPLNIPPTDFWDIAKQPTTDWNTMGVAKRYPGDAFSASTKRSSRWNLLRLGCHGCVALLACKQ